MSKQQVDRVYCVDCSTPQQIPDGDDVCLACGSEGTMFWLLDDDVPSISWDESCTYEGESTLLTEITIQN